MTCIECKYKWCWLCFLKYTENHYLKGKCDWLQFFKPKNTLLNNNNIIDNIYIDNNNNNYINTIYTEEFIGDLMHPNNKRKKRIG